MKSLMYILCLLMIPFSLLGADLPALYHVTIRTQVRYDSSTQMYYYSYKLKNDASNVGAINEFTLFTLRGPNTMSFETTGLRFAGQPSIESQFRRDFPVQADSSIPVGFSALPTYWSALTGFERAEVSMCKDTLPIVAGDSATGIVLMSRALPGIQACEVRPEFQIGLYFDYDVSDTTQSELAVNTDSIEQTLGYSGWTVAPWAPKAVFSPLECLDSLTSYVARSLSYSWITTQAAADKYTSLFSRLRSYLLQSDVKTARLCIDTVLAQANADSSSTLTAEAYALIRFNTEYLKTKLSNQAK